MIALFQKKWPERTEARIDGRPVMIAVRVSTRARSYRLSIPHHGAPILTVPHHGRWSEAEAFLHRQTAWLTARLKRTVKAVAFAGGETIPVRGIEHLIVATARYAAASRSPKWKARRLCWCRATSNIRRAGSATGSRTRRSATSKPASPFTPGASALQSNQSGCARNRPAGGRVSSSGRLNFNWRLVLAPAFVLDYVAAHEVAHLVEMNHSAAFWHTVEKTLPDMARGRAWLKAHGRQLMAYGAEG